MSKSQGQTSFRESNKSNISIERNKSNAKMMADKSRTSEKDLSRRSGFQKSISSQASLKQSKFGQITSGEDNLINPINTLQQDWDSNGRKAASFCVQEVQNENLVSHEVARQNMHEEANLTASIVVEMVRPVYSLSQNSLNHSSLEFTGGVQNTTNEQCKYFYSFIKFFWPLKNLKSKFVLRLNLENLYYN